MDEREDIEALRDAVNEQVDFDLAHKEVVRCVFDAQAFTVDELLDIWNEEDLETTASA